MGETSSWFLLKAFLRYCRGVGNFLPYQQNKFRRSYPIHQYPRCHYSINKVSNFYTSYQISLSVGGSVSDSESSKSSNVICGVNSIGLNLNGDILLLLAQFFFPKEKKARRHPDVSCPFVFTYHVIKQWR